MNFNQKENFKMLSNAPLIALHLNQLFIIVQHENVSKI